MQIRNFIQPGLIPNLEYSYLDNEYHEDLSAKHILDTLNEVDAKKAV